MSEQNSVNDYALQALERQQAAARRRGYFPTSVSSRKRVKATFETDDAATGELNASNLRTLRYRDTPGMARADLLTANDIPKKLEQVMQRMVATHGWKAELSVAALSENWSEVIGEASAAHCWVESFDPAKKVLRLGTDSQVWAAQLRLLLPQLQAKITAMVGDSVIEQVIILGPEATARRQQADFD
ncbi:MAG: DciA family protein [Actinomycetaceae bacterium]|nr:DciA family protein [Actinomycetaceae bacterium]